MQRWDGAVNTRRILPGLIRSANLSFLSGQGRGVLLASGLSRIVDLRNRAERQIDPAPFVGNPVYLNLPLLPQQHAAIDEIHVTGRTNADFYRAYLDHTGPVADLAQELCNVHRPRIAADYAETDQHVAHIYAAQYTQPGSLTKRMRRRCQGHS